jgi:hypothetical protein
MMASQDETIHSAMMVENDDPHISEESEPDSCLPFGVGKRLLFAPVADERSLNPQFFVQRQSLGKRWVSNRGVLPDMSNGSASASVGVAMKKRKLSIPSSGEDACDNMSLSSSSVPVSRRRRKLINRKKPPRITTDGDSCQLPLSLQQILNEDQACVTLGGFDDSHCGTPRPFRRLHVLPATVTVHQVLEHFENKATNDDDEGMRRHFCQTLEALFDKVLVQDLLYPVEVPQFHALFSNASFQQRAPSEIYGCSFLLRLLVRLPHYTEFPKSDFSAFPASIQSMSYVPDLVMLLQRNRQVCFRHDAFRVPTYEELLDWERELVKDTRWAFQEDDENVSQSDDKMVLTTPTKKNSAN